MKKSSVLILLLMVMILAISAVSAADENVSSDLGESQAIDEAVEISTDDATDPVVMDATAVDTVEPTKNAVLSTVNTEVLADPGDKNFTQLQNKIDSAEGYVSVADANYVRAAGETNVIVNKSITIAGDDEHVINANNLGGIFTFGQNASVTLLNVILINGNTENGGAIYNEGSLTITSSQITDNNATVGGAIYNKGILTVTGSTLEGNNATTLGGAIYSENTLAVVDVATFINNRVTTASAYNPGVNCNGGGAIFSKDKILKVEKSIFTGNEAIHPEFGYFTAGGAIYVYQAEDVLIKESTFESNIAGLGGAVIFEDFSQSTVVVKDSEFNYNEAWQGGAINVNEFVGDLSIAGNNFTGNKAVGPNLGGPSAAEAYSASAGAISIGTMSTTGTSVEINDCEFTQNTAEGAGGAVVINENTEAVIENCDFIQNEAETAASAISVSGNVAINGSRFNGNKGHLGTVYLYESQSSITNSNFTNNDDSWGDILNYAGTLTLENNQIDTEVGILSWGAGSEIITDYEVTILENGTYTISDATYDVTAKITDDNGNIIRDLVGGDFKFVVAGNKFNAIYNATTNLYQATCDIPTGINVVDIAYAGSSALTVKKATIKNTRGTFTDLADKINHAQDNKLDLAYDFKYTPELGDDVYVNGIVISDDLTINGNGHTISGNDAARIFNVASGTLTLNNTTLTKGRANQGSAINLASGSALIADYVTFDDNVAHNGALCARNANVNLNHAKFINNDLITRTNNDGGAAISSEEGGSLIINNSVFENNLKVKANRTNGDMMCGAIAVYLINLEIYNSNFTDNSGAYGGALAIAAGSTKIDNCRFINNTAYNGGTIQIYYGAKVDINNSYFEDNVAAEYGSSPSYTSAGGAIAITNNGNAVTNIIGSTFKHNIAIVGERPHGGAISIQNSLTNIESCVFEDNEAPRGGAVYLDGDKTVSIIKSNFTGNIATTAGNAIYNAGKLTLSGNNVSSTQADIANLGEITSTVKGVVLKGDDEFDIVYVVTNTVEIYAVVTDDNGNLIVDPNFVFEIYNITDDTHPVKTVAATFDGEKYTNTTTLENGYYTVKMVNTKLADSQIEDGNLACVRGTYTDLQMRIDAAVAAGNDTLDLPYSFTFDPFVDENFALTGLYVSIFDDITINGNNNYIDTGKYERVGILRVDSADVTINDVEFRNGNFTIEGETQFGAIVCTLANLNINNCTFVDCASPVVVNRAFPIQAYVIYDEASYDAVYALENSPLVKYYTLYPDEDIDTNDPRGHSWAAVRAAPLKTDVSELPWLVLNMNDPFTGHIDVYYGDSLLPVFEWDVTNKLFGIISVTNPSDMGMKQFALWGNTTYGNASDFNPDSILIEMNSEDGNNYTLGVINAINPTLTIKDSTFLGSDSDTAIVNEKTLSLEGNTISGIVYNKGTLSLDGNAISGYIVNEGNISSDVYAVVLNNKTIPTKANNYTLNATLTDAEGNKILDENLKFKVNGEVLEDINYDPALGIYIYDEYLIEFEPEYVVEVVSTGENNLNVRTGIIKNLKSGTFTDLKYRIENAGEEGLTLPYDFTYNADIDVDLKVINLTAPIKIDGNGSVIDGNGVANAFIINAAVTINNTTFANVVDYAIYNNATLTLNNNTISTEKALIINNGNITNAVVKVLDNSTVNATYSQIIILNATFTDDQGNLVNDTDLLFYVEGWECTADYAKGVYTAAYIAKVGQKVATVKNIGETPVLTGLLNISKADVSLTIVANETIDRKQNETITINLVDEFGALLNLTVSVYVTNSTKEIDQRTITTTNGTFTFELAGLPIDYPYTVVAMFTENADYKGQIATATFAVTDVDPTGAYTQVQKLINESEAGATIVIPNNITYIPYVDDDYDYSNGILINKDITIDGNGTTIDANKTYRIFTIAEGVNVTIVNLTMKNGNADIGGAILTSAKDLTISACNFIGNDPVNGSALNIQEGNVVVNEDSLFENNTATKYGGAIYVNAGAKLTVNGAKFKNNTAYQGGAIYSEGDLTVNDATFTENVVTNGGGAIAVVNNKYAIENSEFTGNLATNDAADACVAGGAIYIAGAAKGTIKGSTFKANKAESPIYPNGGAIKIEFGGESYIEDCTFTENFAANDGGAIKLQSNTGMTTKATIDNCTFTNNTAPSGGAVSALQYVGNSEVTIIGSTFTENKAVDKGGAVYLDDLSAVEIKDSEFTLNTAENGGAIYALGDLKVNASTFKANKANGGAAIHALDKYADITLTVTDSTFKDNAADRAGGAIVLDASESHSISYTIADSEFIGNTISTTGIAAGGAIYSQSNAIGTIKGSNFTANRVQNDLSHGGAVRLEYDGAVTIEDCNFTKNYAYGGGAIGLQSDVGKTPEVTVIKCTFTENEAYGGGAIATLNYVGESKVTVTDSTFKENTAAMGGAIYGDVATAVYVSGSDFIGNTATIGGAIASQGNLTVKGSEFTNNAAGMVGNAIAVNRNGNLSLENNIINTENADVVLLANSVIVSYVNATILDNSTEDITDATYKLYAKVVDDKGNLIEAPGFAFNVTGDKTETIAATYNATTKLYEATFDVPGTGVYYINMTYTVNDELDTYIGILRNIKGTYTDLQNQIIDAEGTLVLPYDFAYTAEIDGDMFPNGVVIGEAITIEGNGYTISGNNSHRIFMVNAATTINNVTIVNGSATEFGGAIYAVADLTVANSTFDNNAVAQDDANGGAIMALAAANDVTLNINNVAFTNNKVDNGGAAVAVAGVNGKVLTYNIYDSLFENNTAEKAGANVAGGAIFSYGAANGLINNTVFRNNTALTGDVANGGAIKVQFGGTLTVANSTFEDNKAGHYGGAIAVQANTGMDNALTVDNCTFIGNEATYGAAIGSRQSKGQSTVTIIGSDFDEGNAVYLDAFTDASISTSEFDGEYPIYNLGTLALKGNQIDPTTYIYNGGLITTQVNSTILANSTEDTVNNTFWLYADLYDIDGNHIYDPNFTFTVNGVALEGDVEYDGEYYTALYKFTDVRVNVIDAVSPNEGNLVTEYGILRNIKGTYTDLQNQIYGADGTLVLPYDFIYTEEIDYKYFDPVDYVEGYFNDGVLITDPITINGNGYTICGNNTHRIFNVTSNFALINATLCHGYADYGGAIYAEAVDDNITVTIINATLIENNVVYAGGAAAFVSDENSVTYYIINSTFENNTANNPVVEEDTAVAGGAIYSDGKSGFSYIGFTTFKNNKVVEGNMPNGGAIKVQFGGKLVIINSTFEENEAAQAGGAISIQANTGMNNLVAIINSTFDNNKAQAGGAISSLQGVGNSLVAIFGSDFTENSATQVGGAVYLDDLSAVIVNASNFTDNYAAEKGGAINALGDLIVAGSEFENNGAELGGAIYVSDKYAAVNLDVDGSTFTENYACNSGGAICIDATNGKGITYSIDDSEFTGNYIDCDGTCPAVAGGAVFTEGDANGTIAGSGFIGNSAIVKGVPSNGGAVKVQFGGTSIITDCTFTGNQAQKGGAIDAQANKDMDNNVTVEGCTFTDNYATQAGGAICGLQNVGESTLTVKDSTFVNNAAGLVGGAIYADDLTIASITDSYFSGNDDETNGIFNIYFYKLAEGSVVANNTFDIELVNITTDNDTYAYGENVNVSGDFDWGVNKIPINVTFALYRNGEKLADIDTELTGTSFAEVLEGLLPGTYVASVDSFTEDVYGNYYNITVVAAAEFVIEKANATINVTVGDNKRFAYGDNVTVFIELYSNVTGEGLTANVTVVINDTAMIVEVINGTASFNVSGYEPEHYALVGEFAGDDCYNGPIYGSDVFTVLRPDRILSVETIDTVYGEPTFIAIRVTDYEGNEEQGIVVLNISGTEMAIVVNGTATIEFLPNATGLYLVNATLIETDLDAAVVNDTETFTVYDNPLVIIDAIANITITYGENDVVIITPAYTLDLENIIEGNATIKVYNIKNLTAEVIQNINNLNVTLADIVKYIENFNITADPELIITDIAVGKDGAVVDIPGLNAGAYLMVMNFTSSDYYFGEAITGTVVLPAKADVNITATSVVYGETVTVNVTAIGVNGELLNGTVAYYIDGVDEVYGLISVENGTGSLDITYLLDASEYAIYSVFIESRDNYINVDKIARFTVYQADPTLSVVADDVLYTETPVINITLSGINGIALAGETLLIDVSGMTYVGITDENGTVQVIINKVLPIDTYNITVKFNGNNNYIAFINDTESFTVSNNNNLTFTIDATSVAYPEDVIITVTSEVDGTATVYVMSKAGYENNFTIDVANGLGYYELSGLVPGEYHVAATYEAYGYNATEGETDFTVVKGATEIEAEGCAIVYGNVAIVLVDGLNEDATGNVTVVVNGNTYNATVEDGSAVVEIPDLGVGIYDGLEVTYSGDSNYNGSSTKATIIVTPASSSVVIDDIADVVYNASVEVTYTVVNETTVTVVVKDADGTEITTGVNTTTAGKVIISGLDAGKYTISVSNAGEGNYSASSDEKVFNVLKATITIEPNATGDFVVDGDVNVTFTVPTDITGMLDVTIDGEPVLAFEVINGTCTIPGTYAAGPHTVIVMLTGDTNYENAVGQTTFDIAKVVMEMNATIEAGTAVEDTNVTVTLPKDATGHVLVYVDDMFITSVPIDNGTAAFPIYGFDAGEHNLTVTYDGDDKYTNGTFKATFETEKAPTNTTINATVEGFDVEITVYVNSTVVVNGGQLTLTFNDENITADVKDGVAVFKFSDLPRKTYNITAVYGGNGQFLSSNDTGSAKVLRKSAYLKPVYEPFIFNYGQLYKFRLADKDGNPIGGRTVEFSVHSKVYYVTTDKDGWGQVQLTTEMLIHADKIFSRLIFRGDGYYKPCTYAVWFNAMQEPAKFSNVKAVKTSYKVSEKNKQITATLKDSKGKAIAGKKVALTINGKTFKVSTNSKGVVTFSLNSMKFTNPGKIPFIVVFEDVNYKRTTAQSVITLVKD